RLDSGQEPDLADTVVDVVSAMVSRVFRNPSGHRSVSGQETTGQFSGSNTITFGGDNPGALVLLDEERDALRPLDAPRGGQAFSIGVLSASAVAYLPWCSLWCTGFWCLWGSDVAVFRFYAGACSVALLVLMIFVFGAWVSRIVTAIRRLRGLTRRGLFMGLRLAARRGCRSRSRRTATRLFGACRCSRLSRVLARALMTGLCSTILNGTRSVTLGCGTTILTLPGLRNGALS